MIDPLPRTAAPVRVLELAPARMLRALTRRGRYKYVQPRVVREGLGWKIVSPNCSRNVDMAGGEIDIAWLVPRDDGGWLVHARDHAQQCWLLKAATPTLDAALAQVCSDPLREYWQ